MGVGGDVTERQNSVTCKCPTVNSLKIKVGAGRWKMSNRLCKVASHVFWFAVERKKRLPRVEAHI